MLRWCALARWRHAACALLLRLASLLLALRAALTSTPALDALADTRPPPALQPRCEAATPAPDSREAAFLAHAGAAYGYGGRIGPLRAREFARCAGTAYVDHAGAALFSEALVADTARALSATLLANPRARPRRAPARSVRVCHVARRCVCALRALRRVRNDCGA
jgi:hypothetical protein